MQLMVGISQCTKRRYAGGGERIHVLERTVYEGQEIHRYTSLIFFFWQ